MYFLLILISSCLIYNLLAGPISFSHTFRSISLPKAPREIILPVQCQSDSSLWPVFTTYPSSQVVDYLSVLGFKVNKDLSFKPLLAENCARFIKESQSVFSTMRNHALGLMLQVKQLRSRVESSAFFAIVAVASHVND